MTGGTLAALWVYPVKSARGVPVDDWPVTVRGLLHDRAFMVVDAGTGRFITQREEPTMALVQPSLEGATLRLTRAHAQALEVPLGPTPHTEGTAHRTITVWKDTFGAHDTGEDAALWWSAFLGREARMVRMPAERVRVADPLYAPVGTEVGFADGFPFLITTTGSLADLNARLSEPVTMERFRPNLVIDGTPPFAEDAWRDVRIGGMALTCVKPCARCSITTVDPSTGGRGKEPLRTLASFRRQDGGVMFGQNAFAHGTGRLRVGDAVTADAPSPGHAPRQPDAGQ